MGDDDGGTVNDGPIGPKEKEFEHCSSRFKLAMCVCTSSPSPFDAATADVVKVLIDIFNLIWPRRTTVLRKQSFEGNRV